MSNFMMNMISWVLLLLVILTLYLIKPMLFFPLL